jgi:hypothetical protein
MRKALFDISERDFPEDGTSSADDVRRVIFEALAAAGFPLHLYLGVTGTGTLGGAGCAVDPSKPAWSSDCQFVVTGGERATLDQQFKAWCADPQLQQACIKHGREEVGVRGRRFQGLQGQVWMVAG